MRDSLRGIKKAIQEHSDNLNSYDQQTSSMNLMLGKCVDQMRGKASQSHELTGHIGNLVKVANALQRAHKSMKAAIDAGHEQIMKSVNGMASSQGINLDVGNANSTEASFDTTHGGADTTSPGVIDHGLKGARAADLAKMAHDLPLSKNAPLRSAVALAAGVGVNKNAGSDPFGFSKAEIAYPAEFGQQTRVLSEFEKRQLEK